MRCQNVIAMVAIASLLNAQFLQPLWAQEAVRSAAAAPSYAERILHANDGDPENPEPIISALQSVLLKRDLSFEEWFLYGTAWFFKQRWDRAAAAYETAAGKTADAKEKSAALMFAAQSANMGKRFEEAGRLANSASQILPSEHVIAAYRYAFWTAAGDRLESRVAEDRMKQLSLKCDGTEVCEPITVILVLGGSALILTFVAVGFERGWFKTADLLRAWDSTMDMMKHCVKVDVLVKIPGIL